MTGHNIHSDNHIRKMKLQKKKLDTVAYETISKADTELKGKGKKNKISEQENNKHSTCCSE